MKNKTWESRWVGACQGLVLLLGVTVWSALSMAAHAEQLLKNADFDERMNGWSFYADPKINGSVRESIEDHELRVVIPPGNPVNFVQLIQVVPLEAEKSYCLSFEAKRDGDGAPLNVAYTQGGPPFESYGLVKTAHVNNDWSAHEFVFTALPVKSGNPGVVRLMFGNQTGTIHFRKFSLTPVEDPPLHP